MEALGHCVQVERDLDIWILPILPLMPSEKLEKASRDHAGSVCLVFHSAALCLRPNEPSVAPDDELNRGDTLGEANIEIPRSVARSD